MYKELCECRGTQLIRCSLFIRLQFAFYVTEYRFTDLSWYCAQFAKTVTNKCSLLSVLAAENYLILTDLKILFFVLILAFVAGNGV